jgi:hypothetical protein
MFQMDQADLDFGIYRIMSRVSQLAMAIRTTRLTTSSLAPRIQLSKRRSVRRLVVEARQR